MGNFSNLPSDIMLDILTRLPTETILDCKLVCIPWKDVVSHHPSFSRLHLTRLHDLDSGKLSFLYRDENQQLHYHDRTPTYSTKRIKFTPPFTSFCYNFVGSFNGLVCLYGWKDDHCVCNPVTKEYVMIPKITRDCDDEYVHISSGFGYLPLTNEYKVVALYKLKKEPSFIQTAVYTFGSGDGWRNVGRLEDNKSAHVDVAHGVFVNGALYWLDIRGGNTVSAFDLTEEKFREHVSLPPLPQYGSTRHGCTIGELGGILYCAFRHFFIMGSSFDVWLLKERDNNLDVKEQVEHKPLGWRKEFSFLESKPLAITKSGGVLCFDDSSLGIYDPVASTFTKLVDLCRFCQRIPQIIPHKNTLVSLKEFGEEVTTWVESAEIEEAETPN